MDEKKKPTPQGEAWQEAQRERLAKFSYLRDMLQSPNGTKFLNDLREDTLNQSLYVPGSFDQTAFNLGRLNTYLVLERIQKGEL